MPNVSLPSGQDWDSVNVGKSSGRVTVPKTAAGIAAAKRSGTLTTELKFGAGGNKSAHSGAGVNAKKLEESDELKHATVDKSLSKAIMQARTAKKLTQKDLATAINEKPQVIAQYESGKAIPNPQVISKIERKLGCKLPRPGKKPAAKKTAGVGGISAGGARGPARAGARGAGPPKRR
mmetsp:Transcript_6143/g.12855  ORF Transcript_6143/g.12855 Transcript_6143/m.12855 type:complete len:178 (-) Transcript_6143:491-1024(-)|eukprot:CAMPEP_0183307178 /NCGR_PEP_ID=MMETSP0160_2-20130417/16790_1 /TAXON_ID=2839 ORGANISM="Odontella Sinensis, Strain Grunow 1884" /NCGR_SAMPLE_ID=MMETSP0160_2 /ASSEMBLY_ACC=CAM_ASM_000250 /LENGTH=177 /DNA_ID=CAMNT_0025470721 /DNA_START=158 /DNA_END=691 /DNA_ORIENTATION=-